MFRLSRLFRNPTCRQLPAEVWANILANVDDYDLWLHCRRASRTIRVEVEREFARTCLQELQIIWQIKGHGMQRKKYDARMDELKGISEDSSRAWFGISLSMSS
jgi:hypothetical protein